MIPNTKDRSIASSGVVESGTFGISLNDSAHIMTILRDTLYSDKVLAVLREYSANAWDSHRAAGKPTLPIKVTLPTAMVPTLSIRDFGAGLSQEDVFQVYTQYGASTKRTDDNSVGMLGIGSKSGFAYSDSFTVTSFYAGVKKTYVAVLDASEKGIISLLHEEPCDETGVEIQIAVRPKDISEFERKAKILFKYFNPRPSINTVLPELPPTQASLVHGVIYDTKDENSYYQTHDWVAVMGCVSYRVNLEQLQGIGKDGEEGEDGAAEFLSSISGALYFDIGEVQVSASREELKYSDGTKKALVEKFELLVDEFVQHTLKSINAGGLTPWERRVKAQVLSRLKLPVPKACKSLVASSVPFGEFPKTFTIERNKKRSSELRIAEANRLIIRNDGRSLLGFCLTEADYLVRPIELVDAKGMPLGKKAEWADIEKDLTDFIHKLDLDGITVLKSAEMPWSPPRKDYTGRTINPKHKVRVFKLNPKKDFTRPYSKCWDSEEEREATKEDVFVVIHNFKTEGFDLFRDYCEDEKLLKLFGMEMPTVYGYKTTDKLPVTVETCTGVHYPTWRASLVKTLTTPEVLRELDQWEWANTRLNNHYYDSKTDKQIEKILSASLGQSHLITEFVEKHIESKDANKKSKIADGLNLLRRRMVEGSWTPTVSAHQKKIEETYPLLSLHEYRISVLWGDHKEKWTHYIKSVDKNPI